MLFVVTVSVKKPMERFVLRRLLVGFAFTVLFHSFARVQMCTDERTEFQGQIDVYVKTGTI